MHYVEQGGRERLNPSAGFDTQHYLKQCESFGEVPLNPLYHYLTVGLTRGMTPSPHSNLLCLDAPKTLNGRVEAPLQGGGLSIVGWAIAEQGVESVEVAVDGKRVASAHYGLRRPDVATAHPSRNGALLSGFATHLPPKTVPPGAHRVSVSMRSREGQLSRIEFAVTVVEAPDAAGPSVLRRKMPQAEVDLKMDLLRRQKASPRFCVVLSASPGREAIAAAQQTLRTLVRQTYPDWELVIHTGSSASVRGKQLIQTVAAPFEAFRRRITALQEAIGNGRVRLPREKGSVPRTLYLFLAPGDELGCDALLEWAVASALKPDITLWYSDDRRPGGGGRMEAFFKPGWSPDLLLSFNYLGRAWCVDAQAVMSLPGGVTALAAAGDYERVLHVSEACQGVGHVPKVLQQCSQRCQDSPATERAVLAAALRRRGIQGTVTSGVGGSGFRVKRKVSSPLVSVIIPTCGAAGLIQGCLESLRDVTTYKHFEVVCIENIPARDRKWRAWLAGRVDSLISTRESFNWARFNNLAARRARGECLLFLNDDTQFIDGDWMNALLEHALRPEVATVGALLLYPDRSVQHAGLMLDEQGRGRHAFRHLAADDPGYFGLAHCTRNVIGSTGACLMTRSEVFTQLRGFDAAHPVINNDLDYCLRATAQGWLNVYTPHARLIHHELASRANLPETYDSRKFHERWRGVIAAGDPYFNPNLSREHDQLVVEAEPLETLVTGHPRFARAAIKRILVLKLDHIGDCVNALPAVRRLKRYFPTARLAVLAGRATGPVWHAEPAVDEVIAFDFFHARSGKGKLPVSTAELAAMEQKLRGMEFDLAIDLRKQPDTREVLQMCGADVLIGFDTQGRFPWLDVALEWDEDVPLRTKHGHVADDLVALVEAAAAHSEEMRVPTPRARRDASLALGKAEQRRLFDVALICIHPAAGTAMRQWPLTKFAALIDLLLDLGDCNVALIGGADEKPLADEVLQQVHRGNQVFNLTGRLPLTQLPLLLERSALFVGNNSGPQHLAAAAGIPTIGIHSGVVDAREWGPLGPRAIAVRRDMVCSPCFLEFPEHCQRGVACLHDLPVSYVYRACLQALGRNPGKETQQCSKVI